MQDGVDAIFDRRARLSTWHDRGFDDISDTTRRRAPTEGRPFEHLADGRHAVAAL